MYDKKNEAPWTDSLLWTRKHESLFSDEACSQTLEYNLTYPLYSISKATFLIQLFSSFTWTMVLAS